MEEGLDGEVAREALVGAERVVKRPEWKKTGNRRRIHEEVADEDVQSNVKDNKELRNSEINRTKGNRRRKHEEVTLDEMVIVEQEEDVEEPKAESEEQHIESPREVVTEKVNAARDDEEEEDEAPAETSSRGGRLTKGVAKVLGGDILADKLVLRQIPLLLLCLVFLLLLVANRYQVETLSRKKITLKEKVDELHEQQTFLQKKNQESVRVSQIRDDLKNEKGIDIMPTPPRVLQNNENED